MAGFASDRVAVFFFTAEQLPIINSQVTGCDPRLRRFAGLDDDIRADPGGIAYGIGKMRMYYMSLTH